ncbi:hypothetical protein ACFVR1_01805 [Psychrobacillus sp. NPDC058041]|uniref:hypothetical protein n=1 Tax=Psychrobacillus sp. NPDC058041 TaxID=3346310 RepID=UPI0036DBF6D7
MNKKIIKQTVASALLTSFIFSFSTITYGKENTIQQSIDTVKLEMKRAPLYYVDSALKNVIEPSKDLYPVLNNVKKHYNEVKKLIDSSNLSSKEKKDKIKELDSLYEEKITKGLIPYIDAYNYAVKYLDPILKEMLVAHAAGNLDGVEEAYHKLSYQLDSRTSILYRFTGKAPRDLILEKYKKPSDAKREELRIPVTIYMKNNEVLRLWNEGKKEEARKVMDEVLALTSKTSNNAGTNYSNLLSKEVKEAEALFASNPIQQPEVPSNPPTSGGGSETPSENSAQRALRLAKSNSITELMNYKNETDYSPENWLSIQSLKTTGTNAISTALTTTEVVQALANAKADIDAVKTIAQEEADQQNALASAKTLAINELTSYKNETDYSPENWLIIQSLKTTGMNAISTSLTTAEAFQALANAKADIDAVKTIAQEELDQQNALASAKTLAINELTSYKNEADYSPENWLIIQSLKTTGSNAISTSLTTAEVAQALANAKADIDAVKTIAQEELDQQNALASAKTLAINELTIYKNEADYSPENWLIIQSLKTTGMNAISTSLTTAEAAQALANAKADIDAVKTIAQEELDQQNALVSAKTLAINELMNYKKIADYSPMNWFIIQSMKTTGTNAISTALTTTEVAQALANAKADIDAVQTIAQELPVAILVNQTVAPGASVSFSSSKAGVGYLVDASLDSTDIDSEEKLEELVNRGLASKASITIANANTTINAPATYGEYNLIVVDNFGNLSTRNLNNIVTVGTFILSDNNGSRYPYQFKTNQQFSSITPMVMATEKITNATLTFKFIGVQVPKVTDYYNENNNGWKQVTSGRINGNIVTFQNVNLDVGEWFMIEIRSFIAPSLPGMYFIEVQVNSNPVQKMKINITE